MLTASRALSVWAYTEACDMRKSFNTLAAIVEQQMKRVVLTGDLFVFVSADRTRCKVLYFDGTGMCMFCKRLEKGKFSPLWNRKKEHGLELTPSELLLFLEGSELAGRLALSPPLLTRRDLRTRMPP